MNALIIDDSRAMRTILSKIMKNLGFDTIQAPDGKEGLELFQANADSIEVTLVDWNMPVMNGLEFIQAVRAHEQYASHKLVMVTTETEPDQMVRALMAGVDEFVMKPFTPTILADKLQLIGVRMTTSAS